MAAGQTAEACQTAAASCGAAGAAAGVQNVFSSAGDGAAGEKGSIEKVSDKQLENLGIDAHNLKKEFIGKKGKIAEYDIYKNKKTGELEIYKKGGKGESIPTGEFVR